MCLGFSKYILIGHLGRLEKRNAGVLLYCMDKMHHMGLNDNK
jgi:hypothetical protein